MKISYESKDEYQYQTTANESKISYEGKDVYEYQTTANKFKKERKYRYVKKPPWISNIKLPMFYFNKDADTI
jgi:hypothetical protein